MSNAATETVDLDQRRAEAFADRIASVLDSGAVAIMMSIGHRLGLFDVLAEMPPASSESIAKKADLAERYVREWLAVMVVGRIVSYDPKTRTYRLPREHAACLTRGGPLGNLAVYGQHVALMGLMQEQVVDCFETGAGLSYGDYPCFHQIMAEDSGQTVITQLFDQVLPLVEGIELRLVDGIDVLDAGCGRGLALIELAKRFPASRFAGYDLCGDAIAFAESTARQAGLANIRFETRDLSADRDLGSFDFVTSFDAVHDQKNPEGLMAALAKALRPGGVYLMQDVGGSALLENNLDFPSAALLYAISCTHCTPISIGQGGPGLGTMWGWETAMELLEKAGFAEISRHLLPSDPMNVWIVAHK